MACPKKPNGAELAGLQQLGSAWQSLAEKCGSTRRSVEPTQWGRGASIGGRTFSPESRTDRAEPPQPVAPGTCENNRTMAQEEAEHAAAAARRKVQVRQRWKAAALKETQRVRVEELREKQAREARNAERKQEVAARLERELHALLGHKPWAAVLSHFGASSYKKLLVQFHPDRAPQGASFEDVVQREVVFKYVQQRHDQSGSGGGDGGGGGSSTPRSRPDDERARQRREEEAHEWRERQAREATARAKAQKQAAAEEAERRRNAVPDTAVLRVTGAAWAGFGTAPESGPLGYYIELEEDLNGRPVFRKIPPSTLERADWAPWAQKAAQDALEAADQIWFSGFWRIGHRVEQRLTYMGACADERPPTHDWDVVDSRETEPCLSWL